MRKEMTVRKTFQKALSLTLVLLMVMPLLPATIMVNAAVTYTRISYNGDAGSSVSSTTTTLPSVNGNATQRRAIDNHAYVAAIFGTAGWTSSGYQWNNVDYRYAFDGNWTNYFDGAIRGHCGVEFHVPQIVSQIEYRSRSGQPAGRLHGAVLEGSHDGVNYTPLFTLDVPVANTQYTRNETTHGLNAGVAYKYYRLMGPGGAELNPTELALYTYAETSDPFDVITLDRTLNGGTLYDGFELRDTFIAGVPITWIVTDSDKADMLIGNTIAARGSDESLTLKAQVGSVTQNFTVTVTGILDGLDIPSTLRNEYVLPITSYGKPLGGWSVVEPEFADVLVNGVIAARMFTVNVTLRASYGGAHQDFPVAVSGILDGIDITDPIVSDRSVLPATSFGVGPILWTAVPANYLVNGVVSLPDGVDEGTVTLTASFDGQNATYERTVIRPPAKVVTFTGNEWGWSDTTATPPVGNGQYPFQIGSENARSRYFMYNTKEMARKYFTMYPFGYGDDYEAMLQESPSDWIINLNGDWDFRYDRAPRNRVWPNGRAQGDASNPANTSNQGTNRIYQDVNNSGGALSVFPDGVYGFDTTETYRQTNDGGVNADKFGWDTISVPGNWQVNWNPDGTFKYDRIIYANVNWGWNAYGNSVGSEITMPPTVSNGTATYQRTVTIPENWGNKRIFINFDGADSFFIWVDGEPVGYSEDKFTHKEFDITDALIKRTGSIAGEHTITVQVIRWANGSFYEIQDMIRISGLFRSTYLMARNREDLWDFQLDTKPVNVDAMNNGNPTEWELSIKTALRDYSHHLRETGTSKQVNYELYDAEGKLVGSGGGVGAYEMHTTDLTASGYDARFGGGVRWDARRADRTAWNPGNKSAADSDIDPTIAQISIAKPDEMKVTIPADEIRTWSSEDPYLYKLVMWVDNGENSMYTCVRVGFRYVETILESNQRSTVRVNGKRVTFYGSNIHETNPDTGQAMTLGLMRKDVEISKQFNQNAFRMAHYPHHPVLYDLCDEYGIYIMDEANHETHTNQSYSVNPLSFPLIRNRQLNMLERTKNFPSVVSWSAGNEARMDQSSAYYQTAVLERREADITGRGSITSNGAHPTGGRPSHAEFGNSYAQLNSSMYPGISGWAGTPNNNKPLVLCEYAHAMGNALGNLDSWAAIFESRSNDIGGFIWDWVDQSVWTPIPRTNNNPANGALVTEIDGQPVDYSRRDNISTKTHYLAFGGDWGDNPNDQNFCANGVILADRQPGALIHEMKRQYQRIKTYPNGDPTATSVGYTVRNMFMFTNANEFDMTWNITENGSVIRSGSGVLDVDPVPYGRTGNKYSEDDFVAEFEAITPKPNAEYFFNIQFRLREDAKACSDDPNAEWAKIGHVVAETQIELDSAAFNNREKPLSPLSVTGMTVEGDTATNTTGTVTITGPDFEYTFDKARGAFTSMEYQGRQFAATGPEPTFARARIDNEWRNNRGNTMWAWRTVGQNRTRDNTSVTYGENCVIITAPYTTTEASRLGTGSNTVYTIYPDGEVKVNQTIVFHGSASNLINEVGSVMTLTPGLDNITYHGRGPSENYTDRKWGSDVGIYETTVKDNFTEYIMVQHTGNHIDTRWVAATDDDGFGVLVKAGEFPANNLFSNRGSWYHPHGGNPYNAESLIEFNALYYSQEELGNRQLMNPYELYNERRPNVPDSPIYLHLNIAGRGVGGDQPWDFNAHSYYFIEPAGKTVRYNYAIKPVSGFDPADATEYSREIRNPVQNVKGLMPVAIANGVLESDPAYIAADSLETTATAVQATTVYTNLINAMAAIKPIVNFATAFGRSASPIDGNIIRLEAPAGANLTAVTPVFEVVATSGFSISPNTPQDFSDGSVKYTVTSGSASNEYTVYIGDAKNEAAITSFTLCGTQGIIYDDADSGAGTIIIDMTDRTGSVELKTSPDSITFTGADISPYIHAVQDFSEPVEYTVTAADGLTRKYTVIVYTESTPLIKGFEIDGMPGVIDHINETITVTVPYGYQGLMNVVPVVTINGDSYAPVGAVDFSSTPTRTYTVIKGANSKSYEVTVVIDDGLSADISSFMIGQNSGVINHEAGIISINVPTGENLEDVTPVVVVPLGASYTPTGPVTFAPNAPVSYKVTSAAGVEKIYKVIVSRFNPIFISTITDLSGRLLIGSTVQFDAMITPSFITDNRIVWTAVDAATGEPMSGTTITSEGLLTIGTDAAGRYIRVSAVSADGTVTSNSLIVKVSSIPPTEIGIRAVDLDYGFGYYVVESAGVIGYTANNAANPECIFVYRDIDFTDLKSINVIRSFDGAAQITLYADLTEATNKTLLTNYNDTAGIPLEDYRRYTLAGVTVDPEKAISAAASLPSTNWNYQINLTEELTGLHTLYVRVSRTSGTWAGNYDQFILNYDRSEATGHLPPNAGARIEGDSIVVDVLNEGDDVSDYIVVCAAYNENGQLIEVKTDYLSVGSGDVERIIAPKWDDDPYETAVFVWYKDSYVPYVSKIIL